ncbi:MAG: hypothetical protein WA951_07400 [Leeuwenhoekiella sp.]
MSKIISSFFFLIMLQTLTGCAQNRQLVEEPPFTLSNTYYTSWIAQQPENSSGIDFFFEIGDKPDNVDFKQIFFKGDVAKIQANEDNTRYVAHFSSVKGQKDYKLSSDMSEEANNPRPYIATKSPVDIANDEALIVYSQNGKDYFFKMTNIQDKGTKYPAEAPFNKND